MPDSTSTIRAWARQHGHDVAERGRLPQYILAAYAKAQKLKAPKAATSPAAKPLAKAKAASALASRPAPDRNADDKHAASAVALPGSVPFDALHERVTSLEKQLATLQARVTELDRPRGLRGRRNRE